ncbi:MAG: formylglycine-generating enzyme family protein, partial [Anaerolineae bacterium]
MKRRTKTLATVLLVLITLVLAACSGQELMAVQTSSVQELERIKLDHGATVQAQEAVYKANEADLKAQLAAAMATATNTPEPEPTAVPTVTPTPPLPERPEQTNEMKLVLAPGVEIELVRVPAGEFLMGASSNNSFALDNELPQHTVYLDEYLIGKTEVTVAQFRLFMQATGFKFLGARKLPEGKDNHPVIGLQYEGALAFVTWLSEWTGRKVTLPTEAQWEKAARGTDGRLYPWGDDNIDCNYANVAFCKEGTVPVGSYPKGVSPYGALDMIGNTDELTSDLYIADYYKSSPARNPTGPDSGSYHTVRGGCYSKEWDLSTTSSRHPLSEYYAEAVCQSGLRVVVAV